MSNVTGTVRATLKSPTTPRIYHLPLVVANTEYSQALDPNTIQVKVKIRSASGVAARAQIAYEPGDSSSLYWTVCPGETYEEDGLTLVGKTIYIQCNKPGQVAEILQWT